MCVYVDNSVDLVDFIRKSGLKTTFVSWRARFDFLQVK